MSVLAQISFFEVAMAMLTTALIDRLVCVLPPGMVGPGGWLIDTGAED
ncbi:MAG: hypothetical protein JJT81_14955 [Rubellimicrobium sp.]|nr:hypothetical protein [Rubellimicrobium sp.]